MLCLLLTACWHSVVAGGTELAPSNHTTDYTTTASSDPWSPVVGDTESELAVNERATNLPDGKYGRRAAISLVENIRKQLMQDNYDYMNNDSGEAESPDDSVTTTVRTTPEETMSIRTSTTVPRNSTFYVYRATHLLPPTSSKSPQIQMQVASVSIPLKSNKGKNIHPLGASPLFRAFNDVSQSPATKMFKNKEPQIVVSKKDLLYYIDDSHLSRKNAGMIMRRKYDSSDIIITNSTNGNKHVLDGKQKLDQRNNLKDSHSKRQQITEHDINEKGQHKSQLRNKTLNKEYLDDQNNVKDADDLLKTKYESGIDNQFGSKDIEYTETVLPNGHHKTRRHREDNAASDDKNTSVKSCSYSDENDESQNTQNNDEENASAVSRYMNQPLRRMKKVKNNLQTSHENDSRDSEHNQLAERQTAQYNQNFRRRNQLRREKERRHVPVSHPDNHQNIKLLRKNTTRRDRKQRVRKNNKMRKMALEFEQFKKFRRQRMQQQKRQQNGVRHNKKNQPKRRQRRKKVVRKKYVKRKLSRKNNMLGDLYGKSDEHEDQNKPNDVLDNQIDEMYDKITDTTVTIGNLSDTKEDHGQNSQNENDKNVDENHDYIDHEEVKEENNNDDLDDNPHDDEFKDVTPQDEFKDEQNVDQKDQEDKKVYVDSIDNEELEGFNGRRMYNDDKNSTQVKKPDNQCKDGYQCESQKDEIQNPQDDNQLKADTPSAKKYKLLEVPVAGGSRRSNKGNRQIIQERDSNGVALYAVDEGPFPQFRLPRDRRQYMDDHVDKRPPLLELSKKSSGGHSGRHHG